ncbi:MAG TPA: tetratricopeptide repeat protein [Bacteroidota bacterium]|nr:tetratricopeptide repeat protein [Bacteroidota bacterium]
MLNPKKKIVKKELKQDTLLTTFARTEGFYYEHKKYVNYALTALVIAAIALVIFINNRRTNNAKASLELGRVMSILDANPADPAAVTMAIEGRPEQGIAGLRKIVENYGGTDAGNLAKYYLGNAYCLAGAYPEAIESYRDFSGDDPLLVSGAKSGEGASLEALKQYDEAAKAFESAAKSDPRGISAPEHLNSAARCFALAGKQEEALRLLRKLKEEYPTSTFAREADRAITRITL